jgi:integrase
MLLLGLRRSEACGLRWSDVNLDEGTIRIVRGVQRAALVQLNDELDG